jgi:hypothetical protein
MDPVVAKVQEQQTKRDRRIALSLQVAGVTPGHTIAVAPIAPLTEEDEHIESDIYGVDEVSCRLIERA